MKTPLETPPSSQITEESVYVRRREFMRQAGLFAATSAAWGTGLVVLSGRGEADPPKPPPPPSPTTPGLKVVERGKYVVDEPSTPFGAITTYNNYYELGVS